VHLVGQSTFRYESVLRDLIYVVHCVWFYQHYDHRHGDFIHIQYVNDYRIIGVIYHSLLFVIEVVDMPRLYYLAGHPTFRHSVGTDRDKIRQRLRPVVVSVHAYHYVNCVSFLLVRCLYCSP
jgi:hypothetical protein